MYVSSIKVKDFSGQNIYVGLDVHYKSWTVSIFCDEFELKSFNQPADPRVLKDHLTSNYPNGKYHLAYEAGFCGFWIQRYFSQNGIKCEVINPADIPSTCKENKRKADKVDSRKIARSIRNGDAKGIYIPDEVQEENRQLVRARSKIVKDTTRIKNRIKAHLKVKGICVPQKYAEGKWSIEFIKWLQAYPLTGGSRLTLDMYLDELVFLREKEKQIMRHIQTLSKSELYAEDIGLLTSIPGIGILAAMTILTELGDIKRFRKLENLNSYCGLTPNTHSTGETERVTGISRMGNAILKTLLVECAWMAVRKDPALLLYYKQCLKVMKGNKAIIKVTRKLLNRIRYVLMNRQQYVTGIIQ